MKIFIFFKAFLLLLILHPLFAASEEGDVVIINSNETQSQSVTAPVITPSKASDLRKAREDAEISTESYILEKLEAERLKDEQKRVDKIMSNTQPEKTVVLEEESAPAETPQPQWYFGEKAFLSLGGGIVNYYGPDNIHSTEKPALFVSLGGYTPYNLIFDFTAYWSQHFVNSNDEYGVHQLSAALSLKFSPLKGRLKPYGGVTGAYTGRRYCQVNAEGHCYENHSEIGKKEWQQAFDAGPTVGVDVALGPRLGLNVNFCWLFNISTEEQRDPHNFYEELLSEKSSIVVSGNVRFYF